MWPHTSPRLSMSHLFIIFKAYTCWVLLIFATATYNIKESHEHKKNIPQSSSGADAAVLVRWSTNTVRTKQPAGSAVSPPGGQAKNCTQLRPDCIQMLISNVHLPQNNVGIHF